MLTNRSERIINQVLIPAIVNLGGTVPPPQHIGSFEDYQFDLLNAFVLALVNAVSIPTPAQVNAEPAGAVATHAATSGNGSHIPSSGITDSNVATNAAVTWSKVSKSGAVASDVGAVDLADARLTNARVPLAHIQSASTITDFAAAVGLTPLGLICQGRLTFTSGVGLTTADVLAATTLYFTPYGGNGVDLWNGSAWQFYTFTELSLSLSGLAANTNYDVFLSDAPGLTLTAVAWSGNTTRASAISLRDGVWVKAADNRRFLGTFRTTTTIGQSEDSLLRRFLSNAQNLEMRRLSQTDTTSSWTYTTATWRQVRAQAANQVEVLLALPGRQVAVTFTENFTGLCYSGIGVDSTTIPSVDSQLCSNASAAGTNALTMMSALNTNNLAIGYHTVTMLEYGGTSGTFTGGGSPAVCNLKGLMMG